MLRYLVTILFLTSAPIVAVGTLNFIVDPFHYFRDGRVLVAGIAVFRSERFINAGLVRHREFDGVILGTSMVQNFSASQVSQLFNNHFINLGMGGSTLLEQAVVIREAEIRKRGAIKRVLWGLDERGWLADPNAPVNPAIFPQYLYQSSSWPLITSYLLSMDIFKIALSGITRRGVQADADDLYRWAKFRYVFSCDTVKKNYLDGGLEGLSLDVVRRIASAQVAAMIEPIVRDYPDTVFHLFVPPYSSAEYFRLVQRAPGLLEALEPFSDELAKLPQRYKNVHVYDFRTHRSIVSNLNLFKDGLHYAAEVNDFMANYMASNDGLPSDGTFMNFASTLTETQVFEQCPN